MSVWCNAWAIRPSRRPWIEKPSTQKSFVSSSWSIFIYNSSQSVVLWGLERQIKIRLCFQSENPSEKFTIRVKVYGRVKIYRSSESLLTGWTYYYPSGNIVIRVKIWSSEWNCRPGENIPSEKITIGTKTCRLNKIVPSEWKYSHPSENIVIRVKDCLPSEKVQSDDPSGSI